MPQTRSTKVQTPINSDTFNLTGDLATMAESIPALIPVTNDAEGDSIATARAASGFAVSDARPLTVYHTTNKTIRVKDAAGWRDLDYPLGLVYQENVLAPTGSIGTTITVVRNIASYAFKAGRKYEIKWYFEYSGTTAGNYVDTSIHTCSTADGASVTTGLTKLGGASHKVEDASVGHHGECEAWYNPGSDSTVQIKFTANIWVGSGSVVFQAGGTNPTRYSIIDHGAAF